MERFVGNWDVIKTFYPRSGDPVKSQGECHQSMMHEGRFLKSEFIFQSDKLKVTGLGIVGYEADAGKFTSVWTDSRSTRMSLRQSKDKFDGKEIVLYSQTVGEGGKEARVSRTVTRLEDEGNTIIHRQYVPDPEGKERTIMELKMTRKKDKVPPNSMIAARTKCAKSVDVPLRLRPVVFFSPMLVTNTIFIARFMKKIEGVVGILNRT